MNVAIFADVHGRLLLCLKLCARWQRETGQKLDLILQAGDMGIFPHLDRLDAATIKHAQHDPTELGFAKYFTKENQAVQAVLNELSCNLVFVRGNHEDHAWLDELEEKSPPTNAIFPVDFYQRIYCLKAGVPYHFESAAGEKLSVLGIGRIGAGERQLNSAHIQPHEIERLFRYKASLPIDILLTHDLAAWDKNQPRPANLERLRDGVPEIRQALNRYQPRYHFFGHVGRFELEYPDANQTTTAYKMADLSWNDNAQQALHAKSMGILRWQNRDEHSFEWVTAAWLQEYTAFSWEYL